MFECTLLEWRWLHIFQAFSRRLHYTTGWLCGIFFKPFLNKPLLERGSKEQLQFHPTKTVETLSIYTQNFYKVYSTTSLYTYTIHRVYVVSVYRAPSISSLDKVKPPKDQKPLECRVTSSFLE